MSKIFIYVASVAGICFFVLSGCSLYRKNGFGINQRINTKDTSHIISYINDSLKVNMKLNGNMDYKFVNKKNLRLNQQEKAGLRKARRELMATGKLEALFAGYDWMEDNMKQNNKIEIDSSIFTNLFSFYIAKPFAKAINDWKLAGFKTDNNLYFIRKEIYRNVSTIQFLVPVKGGYIFYYLVDSHVSTKGQKQFIDRKLANEKDAMDSLLSKSTFSR